MKYIYIFLFLFICTKGASQEASIEKLPKITFQQDSVHLGVLTRGEQVPMEFIFTNTGDADLIIEIVTTCKCTSINWPKEPLKPGDKGIITAIYDTTTQNLGDIRKTLDVVANTDPLLVEAVFTAKIIE